MPIKISGQLYDTMKEACERIGVSRQTMLRYLKDGFFTEPQYKKQGKGKAVRYFSDEWYSVNEARLRAARGD